MTNHLKLYTDAAKILCEYKDNLILNKTDKEKFYAAYQVALDTLAEMYMVQSFLIDYMENGVTAKETILQIIKLTRNGG